MSMSENDWQCEMAIDRLHYDAVMKMATKEQSILLLVEGESEVVAISELLYRLFDYEKIGLRIGNYNGNGNLVSTVRLLKEVISFRFPIIVTYDNDPPSIAVVEKCKKHGLFGGSTYPFKIPHKPVVTYSDGHSGGAFEESFPPEVFLDAVFSETILPPGILAQKEEFKLVFDKTVPWLHQVRKFTTKFGFKDWSACKPKLAENLATGCSNVPKTFEKLGNLVQKIRLANPIQHPNDVELPKVHGLTYFPDEELSDENTEDQTKD